MFSKIYFGRVRHRRHQPCKHRFDYPLFMLYLDLDELPKIFQKYWFWSVNRKNLASFQAKDYLSDERGDIRSAVIEQVEKKYQVRPQGPIRMLTHLRYFGHCFNPVTFYYCFDVSGEKVEYVVAQINNTPWNERHCYVLKNDVEQLNAEHSNVEVSNQRQVIIDTKFEKSFHVSPFLPMDMNYHWRFTQPQSWLTVNMKSFQNNNQMFDATLALQQFSIDSKNLAKALIRFPLMTVQVIISIYWQAVKLWFKKVPFYSNQPGDVKK